MSSKIGSMILKYRKLRKLKQNELAEIAGINRMSIGNYERGTRIPNAEILQKIADALEVSISDLLGTSSDELKLENNIDLLSKIFDKDSIGDATNLLSEKHKIAFKKMYFTSLQNLGIVDQLSFGDISMNDLDYMYLSTTFTETFRKFNNEVQAVIKDGKSELVLEEMNEIIDAALKYNHELSLLLRKNIGLLQVDGDFYIENERPYFEEEIIREYT